MPQYKNKKRKNKIRSDAKFDSKTAGIVGRALGLGMTYDDIGYLLAVKGHTVQDWQQRYPQFDKAIKKAREAIKAITIAQMLRAAWGYDYEEVTETYVPKEGLGISVKDEEIDSVGSVETPPVLKSVKIHKKHQPPDKDLLKFIILNRDKGNWTDVKRIDVVSKNADISLAGQLEAGAIDELVGSLTKQVESKEIESGDTSAISGDNTERPFEEQGVSEESSQQDC